MTTTIEAPVTTTVPLAERLAQRINTLARATPADATPRGNLLPPIESAPAVPDLNTSYSTKEQFYHQTTRQLEQIHNHISQALTEAGQNPNLNQVINKIKENLSYNQNWSNETVRLRLERLIDFYFKNMAALNPDRAVDMSQQWQREGLFRALNIDSPIDYKPPKSGLGEKAAKVAVKGFNRLLRKADYRQMEEAGLRGHPQDMMEVLSRRIKPDRMARIKGTPTPEELYKQEYAPLSQIGKEIRRSNRITIEPAAEPVLRGGAVAVPEEETIRQGVTQTGGQVSSEPNRAVAPETIAPAENLASTPRTGDSVAANAGTEAQRPGEVSPETKLKVKQQIEQLRDAQLQLSHVSDPAEKTRLTQVIENLQDEIRYLIAEEVTKPTDDRINETHLKIQQDAKTEFLLQAFLTDPKQRSITDKVFHQKGVPSSIRQAYDAYVSELRASVRNGEVLSRLGESFSQVLENHFGGNIGVMITEIKKLRDRMDRLREDMLSENMDIDRLVGHLIEQSQEVSDQWLSLVQSKSHSYDRVNAFLTELATRSKEVKFVPGRFTPDGEAIRGVFEPAPTKNALQRLVGWRPSRSTQSKSPNEGHPALSAEEEAQARAAKAQELLDGEFSSEEQVKLQQGLIQMRQLQDQMRQLQERLSKSPLLDSTDLTAYHQDQQERVEAEAQLSKTREEIGQLLRGSFKSDVQQTEALEQERGKILASTLDVSIIRTNPAIRPLTDQLFHQKGVPSELTDAYDKYVEEVTKPNPDNLILSDRYLVFAQTLGATANSYAIRDLSNRRFELQYAEVNVRSLLEASRPVSADYLLALRHAALDVELNWQNLLRAENVYAKSVHDYLESLVKKSKKLKIVPGINGGSPTLEIAPPSGSIEVVKRFGRSVGRFLPKVELRLPGFTEKEIPSGVGATSEQGLRPDMEDAHTIIENFTGVPGRAFYAVYDGHGGREASAWASHWLHEHLQHALVARNNPIEALKAAHRLTDQELKTVVNNGVGTTTVVAYRQGSQLFIANVGDSEAILVTGKRARRLSTNHSLDDQAEVQRIQQAGGRVDIIDGVKRLNYNLNMARSLGDWGQKNRGLSGEPSVKVVSVSSKDRYLVLACDGFTNSVKTEEIPELIKNAATTQEASQILAKTALDRGSDDNVTVLVIPLNPSSENRPASSGGIDSALDQELQTIGNVLSRAFTNGGSSANSFDRAALDMAKASGYNWENLSPVELQQAVEQEIQRVFNALPEDQKQQTLQHWRATRPYGFNQFIAQALSQEPLPGF